MKRENLEPSSGSRTLSRLVPGAAGRLFFFHTAASDAFPFLARAYQSSAHFHRVADQTFFLKKKKGEGVRNCSFAPVSGGVLTGGRVEQTVCVGRSTAAGDNQDQVFQPPARLTCATQIAAESRLEPPDLQLVRQEEPGKKKQKKKLQFNPPTHLHARTQTHSKVFLRLHVSVIM